MKSFENQNIKSKKEIEKEEEKINEKYRNACGQILEKAIKDVGLKQNEFADKIGVPKGTVSAWTIGTQSPKYAKLLKILDVLNEEAQKKKLPLYSISHLRGDIECQNISNQEIKNRTHLTDEAINTLVKLPEKDIDVGPLFNTPKMIKHVDIANTIIADEDLYTIFQTESTKVISKILKEYPSQTIPYQDIVKALEIYSSKELSNAINNTFNCYIRETLKNFYINNNESKNKK